MLVKWGSFNRTCRLYSWERWCKVTEVPIYSIAVFPPMVFHHMEHYRDQDALTLWCSRLRCLRRVRLAVQLWHCTKVYITPREDRPTRGSLGSLWGNFSLFKRAVTPVPLDIVLSTRWHQVARNRRSDMFFISFIVKGHKPVLLH